MKLSERMLMYEKMQTTRKFIPYLPTCIRLDGVNFSKFTHNLKYLNDVRKIVKNTLQTDELRLEQKRVPYNSQFSGLMIELTKWLVQKTGARMGYTQSDEITLILYDDDINTQPWYDGRIQKLISIIASYTSVMFNSLAMTYLPNEYSMYRQIYELKIDPQHLPIPIFDCRIWQVPKVEEAVNVLIWREQDAVRNSISMAAQCYFSATALHKKNTKEMQEMLWQRGVNWNDYPEYFKHGTYIQKRKVLRPYTVTELETLPLLHAARKNPNLQIERTEFMQLAFKSLVSVQNRVDVVFSGANVLDTLVIPEEIEDIPV